MARECWQVTGRGVTEPGLQADSLLIGGERQAAIVVDDPDEHDHLLDGPTLNARGWQGVAHE
jgi:hypothetical protein